MINVVLVQLWFKSRFFFLIFFKDYGSSGGGSGDPISVKEVVRENFPSALPVEPITLSDLQSGGSQDRTRSLLGYTAAYLGNIKQVSN